MNKNKTYHLWLMPQQASSNHLADTIKRLSDKYQTRLFEPHVTLAGEITGPEDELLKKTKALAVLIKQLTLTPFDIQYLNEFYRSLFLAVTLTEPLIQANKDAKQLFELPSDETYMPHLSLFYGDLPVSEKKKIKKSLNSKVLNPFIIDHIILLCTDNESGEWTAVESFPLC